jgi:hypothetical protein
MNGFRAYREGLSRAAGYWELVVVMVVVGLLSALVAVAPAAVVLLAPARRPAIQSVIDGVDGWMVIEALSTPPVEEGTAAFAGGAESIALPALLAIGTVLLSAWLSSAFLSGGALRIYAEGDEFRLRRFVRTSWRWFGTLLLVALLQAVGTILLLALLLALAGAGVIAIGGWMAGLIVPVLLLVALLWLVVWELARVAVVVGGRRNVFRAFGRAVSFVFRRPLNVTVLYALSSVSWLALYGLYRWALMPRFPRAWWLLIFLLQQAFVAFWLWIRLGRWAGGVVLFQASGKATGVGAAEDACPSD